MEKTKELRTELRNECISYGDIEYIVSTEIEDEDGNIIDLGLNVFASSEEEAMNKADDNIREQNSQYEDSSIDIVSVNKKYIN